MLVEIAICTWNRATMLEETLRSLENLIVPGGIQWQLIVVDNNSTDRTANVLNAARDRLPLTVAVEFEAGHSHARNRAISVSRGDLILWTDDDVRVDPNWLSAYCRAATEEPQISFWGGRIEPVFTGGRPQWIEENWQTVSGCFAQRDLGQDSVPFTPERLPYGANFAVRGDVQRQFLFDTRWGRVGSRAVGGDEIEMMRRLLAAGYGGRWLPTSWVWHVIPPERATEAYVFHYFEGQGIELVQRNQAWYSSSWRLRSLEWWHAVQYYWSRRWRA